MTKPNPFSRHSYIYYEEMQEKSFPIRAVFDLQTNFIVKFSENSKSKSISWVWNDGPLDIFTASKNTKLQIRFRTPSQRPDAGEVLLGRREVGRGGRVVGARGHRRRLGNSVMVFLRLPRPGTILKIFWFFIFSLHQADHSATAPPPPPKKKTPQ